MAENTVDPLKTQHELADAWSTLAPDYPKENINVLASIEHVVRLVRELETTSNSTEDGRITGRPIEVLVTGSLHLVGGVIEVAGLSDVAL